MMGIELSGREYRRNVADTRVLMALVSLYERSGRVTVDDVACAVGRVRGGLIHRRLLRLRAQGLIAWEPCKAGTLRPLVTVVARG